MEYFKVLPQHLPGGAEENHKKTSLRIVNVLPEILVSHFLNTSENHHHFRHPVGLCVCPFRQQLNNGQFRA
jgi:hypothetical protein